MSSNSTMLTQLYETRHIIIGHRSSIRTLNTAHKSSRVFSVDTVTRLWVVTEVSGFDSRQGKQTFFYSILSRPVLGPKQPPTTRIKEVLYRGAKQPVRDAQCPSPCAANVTFKHNYTFTPPPPANTPFLFAHRQLYLQKAQTKSWDELRAARFLLKVSTPTS